MVFALYTHTRLVRRIDPRSGSLYGRERPLAWHTFAPVPDRTVHDRENLLHTEVRGGGSPSCWVAAPGATWADLEIPCRWGPPLAVRHLRTPHGDMGPDEVFARAQSRSRGLYVVPRPAAGAGAGGDAA